MSEETAVKGKGGVSKEVYEWIESIVFALVVVILIFTFLFRIVRVDGSSMNKTLYNDDKVIVSNLFYTPKQGDIIITTQDNMFGEPLIKRIIAVEGQTIDMDPVTGAVTVDGVPYGDEHAYFDPSRQFSRGNAYTYPLVIEEGKIFCMGDNRNNSTDSRSNMVGMIDEDSVLGKAYLRIFPITSFSFL